VTARVLINIPPTAKRGDVIEIKTLVSHPMESGYRVGFNGALIPRDIIKLFVCTYNGEEIFRAELSPAIAANPLHRVLHGRNRERHDRLRMDRRQRLLGVGIRHHHGRMTWVRRLALVGLAPALTVAVLGAFATDIPMAERRSGYDLMGRETRAMQDDDNRQSRHVLGARRRGTVATRRRTCGQSCASCHGDAGASMKGVAARYPAIDAPSQRPIDLEQRINQCRTERQHAAPLAFESKELLALTAFVARQSRGEKIAVEEDARTRPFIAEGRDIFRRRQGQLNLSCAQCHDDNWGQKLAGAPIPQAHPTGYPLYRLEWQTLGSLQRRLRNCLVGMRAEPYPFGAPEYVALEFYLMFRARGLAMETPAVRP